MLAALSPPWSMIPKLLHFTWKTADLPRVMQRYLDAWRRLHPGWDIRLWTDDTMLAFVRENYPDLLATYEGYPKMIQRADAFRYLVLGKLGGIYADLDVEPLQPVDSLLGFDCFLGVEPLEHINPDRIHQGVPFLFTNAFMGSVPNHPMWQAVIGQLAELADQETFFSTGPSMVTAVALSLDMADRPALLLPEVWSPLRTNGMRTTSDAKLKIMLAGLGPVVAADQGTLVSHVWLSTWVPWHKRGSRIAGIFQVPTIIKWWLRRRKHPELLAVEIRDPLLPYTDQRLAPVADRPHIHVAVRLGGEPLHPDLSAALLALDYPKDRLTFAYHESTPGIAADNAILDTLPGDAEKVLLVDGAIRSIPSDALVKMLAAQRPVVSTNVVDGAGGNADPALFRLKDGTHFRILYKLGGTSGEVRRDLGYRSHLGQQKVFRLLPVDGVGESFVLIDRAVVNAGVRFAAEPYKLHRGAEAFGIMARDKGFEAAGLPQVRVVRAG